MNEDLLIELLKKAPKKPSGKEMSAWEEQFEKDYPKPWIPTRNNESMAADFTALAAGGDYCNVFSPKFDRNRTKLKESPFWHWAVWREECQEKFIEDYPAIWAKQKYAEMMA